MLKKTSVSQKIKPGGNTDSIICSQLNPDKKNVKDVKSKSDTLDCLLLQIIHDIRQRIVSLGTEKTKFEMVFRF